MQLLASSCVPLLCSVPSMLHERSRAMLVHLKRILTPRQKRPALICVAGLSFVGQPRRRLKTCPLKRTIPSPL
jgi:hypothetical protein